MSKFSEYYAKHGLLGGVNLMNDSLVVKKFGNGGGVSDDVTSDKKWIQDAIKHKGILRKKANEMALIKDEDENLSNTDLNKLESLGGVWAKRVSLARTLKKFEDGGELPKGNEDDDESDDDVYEGSHYEGGSFGEGGITIVELDDVDDVEFGKGGSISKGIPEKFNNSNLLFKIGARGQKEIRIYFDEEVTEKMKSNLKGEFAVSVFEDNKFRGWLFYPIFFTTVMKYLRTYPKNKKLNYKNRLSKLSNKTSVSRTLNLER